MTRETAILDFGSGKITVIIGERGVNGTLSIKSESEVDYAGFGNGEWYDPENLPQVIGRAISSAEANAGVKIERLYVGVPGEFSVVRCKDVSIAFKKRRKVKDEDVYALMSAGDTFAQDTHEVINIQPIYYNLDNDRRVIQPVGMATTQLGAIFSYVLAETSFTRLVKSVLARVGITDVEFVSSILAESLLVLDGEKRDNTAVLIDIGYITTSVAVVRGDGLLSLNSFSMGGGHISGDLAEALEISFTDAESIKRKVMLSINAGENDIYEITSMEGIKTLPAQLVNEIATYRIGVIAKAIEKCLSLSEYEYPDYVPYSLTGGGICFMRGAKDVLSQRLGRNVEIVAPRFPQLNRPNRSSSLGLLDMAIKSEEPIRKKGFFARLFNK